MLEIYFFSLLAHDVVRVVPECQRNITFCYDTGTRVQLPAI